MHLMGSLKASFLNYFLSINKHQIILSVYALRINPPNLNKFFLGDALVSCILL